MSEIDKDQHTSTSQDRFDQSAIEHLLRLAGPRPSVPDGIGERVRQATHDEWRGAVDSRRWRTVLWAGLGLAAAATLAMVVVRPTVQQAPDVTLPVRVAELTSAKGSVLRSNGTQPARVLPVGEIVLAGDLLETGPDARGALGLGANVALRMDTDTKIRLLDGRRLSLEQGSIYVDSGTPGRHESVIEIVTEYGVVTDIGTQFQVRGNGEHLNVRVREGEVRLSRGEEVHQVGMGTLLRLTASGELTRQDAPIYGPEWDWILEVAPSFSLEGETLETFLTWVSRETGWDLVFSGDIVATSLTETVLHGSIAGLRPSQALDAVLPTCGLTHRLSGGTLLIEPRHAE